MKVDKKNSAKLVRWIYFIPIISMIIAIVAIATFSIYKEENIYKKDVIVYKAKLVKIKKIEIQDRILKLTDQIRFNEKILLDASKNELKNMVDLAYKNISDTYKKNHFYGKTLVLELVKNNLRGMRFFNDLSGYFYIYKLDGTCLLLPTNPEYEGKNLLNIKDATGTKIIQKAINMLKTKDRIFASWYWYKPGSKHMQKKIGYFRKFKPLNIYIGSGFYEDDVIKKAKKIALKILRNYKYGKKGYIFAYDYKGNTLCHIKKDLIGKNRLNLVVDNRHIVKEMIMGAKKHKNGFFINYTASYDPKTHKPAKKISYVKSIPEFGWIIGTGYYIKDIRDMAKSQYNILKKELNRIIQAIVAISVILVIVLATLMMLIARKIKYIFDSYEEDLSQQYSEIVNQKKIFQLLFEKSKDGIFLDSEYGFLDCNEAAVEMFGAKNKGELLIKNALDLLPKLQPDGVSSKEKLANVIKIAQKEGAYRGEWLSKKLDGTTFWIEIVMTLIKINEEQVYHTVVRDISKRKEFEQKLKEHKAKLTYMAEHDTLTDLPNRHMFNEIISYEMSRIKREDKNLALLFLDFDGFKHVNDFYGHEYGDELLKLATKRLKNVLRQSDYLFRFGGDEFVLLLSDFDDENALVTISEKLIKAFSTPFIIKQHPIKIGASIGVAVYPTDGKTMEELVRNADIAMYRAKEAGKNRFVFFEDAMYKKIIQKHNIEEEIKRALKNDEFVVYYQPQVDIKNNKLISCEALVRWDKNGTIVSPGEFLGVASQSNLISEIGNVVMDKAIKFASTMKELSSDLQKISINLDNRQLKDDNLLNIIKGYLNKHKCDASLIEFEITEGFIMSDVEGSYKLLKEIRELGCSIAIDDFGTGYSSLAYIKKLPLDVLKIDQSFIRDIPGIPQDEAIVRAVIELGKGLGLSIVAEGIEKEEQNDFLKENGCFIIQGYLYSKPLSKKSAISFIKNFGK